MTRAGDAARDDATLAVSRRDRAALIQLVADLQDVIATVVQRIAELDREDLATILAALPPTAGVTCSACGASWNAHMWRVAQDAQWEHSHGAAGHFVGVRRS